MSEDWAKMWSEYYQDEQGYGETLQKRASGELQEKIAHASFAKLLKSRFYQSGDSVVDIGCAAGHLLRSLRNHTDPEISYIGLDFNPYYLDLARATFGDSAQFIQGDAFNLPLDDASIDIAVINLFHHFPDIAKPLAECIRVSRKWVVWRTPVAPVTHIVKVLQSELRGGDKYFYFNLFSESYIRSTLAGLGVTEVDIFSDTEKGEYSNRDDFGATASASQDGAQQVVGNLLVDWKFVCFSIPNR